MNNDGTVSYHYKQGITKYSNGILIERSSINLLLNGEVNIKWVSGGREIFEMLNDKRHGPVIVYDFEGKVKMSY